MLSYPVTDLAMDTSSYARIANGFTLTRERMRYFRDAYLRGPEDVADWRASPLRAPDLSNLPHIEEKRRFPLTMHLHAALPRPKDAGGPLEPARGCAETVPGPGPARRSGSAAEFLFRSTKKR